MSIREMNADELLMNHPLAHESLLEDDLESDWPEESWETWRFHDGFARPVPASTVVGEHTSYGPREPSIVWTGERWVCLEDDLDDQERSLMDAVAAQCPGGLGGWN